MPKIKITTNRLPQPDRGVGAILEVSEQKAASLVSQGFAVILDADDPQPVKVRGRPRKNDL